MGAPNLINGKPRAAFRYKAFLKTNLPIRITPLGDSDLLASEIFDISTTGVSTLVTKKEAVPHVGQGVRLDLVLMDSSRITCIGRVARMQKFEGQSEATVKLGIQFYDLPLRYKLAIKKSIDKAVADEESGLFVPDYLNPEDATIVPDGFSILADASTGRSVRAPFISEIAAEATTFFDVIKLIGLFALLAFGVYWMDHNSSEFVSKRITAPGWATQVFEVQKFETRKTAAEERLKDY